MKKQSRLTALLLALCMLMSTLPVSALADGILTLEDYLSAVQRVQQELSESSIPVEEENAYTLTRTTTTETIVRETVTGELSGEGESAFTLPVAGKLELSTAAAADAYQWQIDVGGVWANIVGDTAAAVTLTYAKVQNALSGGTARVRCAMTQDGQTVYSAVAAVTVDETVKTQTVEGTEEISAVSYTSEAPRSLARTLNAGVGTYANDNSTTMYYVYIKYLFAKDDSIAAETYTAEVSEGSSIKQTVKVPEIQGYLAYDENDNLVTETVLEYNNIQETHTITVYYKPTDVNYTVNHYQQNVDDDGYTLADTETTQGLTNSTVPEVKNTYDGFYALVYERPTIAADGSTVVEVYYDRYYYLMNFDLDGGYGVEPIYARYGAPITGVGTPTKAGYTFSGWSEDGTTAVTLPTSMPAANKTYKAVWTPDATAKVTIVFWGENADDEEYSYIKSAQVNVKPGMNFTYSEDGTLICALEVHTHNLNDCYKLTCKQEEHTHSESCYNKCGQSSHTHDMSCYAGVGSASSAGTGAPDNPSNGYVYRQAWTYNEKVIYINGTWYKYTGSTGIGDIAPTTCNQNEHTHTDACLGCDKTEHTHSIENNCYTLTCTKPEHTTHTSDCYMNGAGLDSNLWTFKESDTVTVAADGSSVVNVYYDRVEYSVQFYTRDNKPKEYTELKITAKWGANILDKWPSYNNSSSWYVSRTGDTWQNSIQVMPVGGAKFYGPKEGKTKVTAYYYVEVLPGEDGSDHNGVKYKLHHTDTSVSSGNVTNEERYEIQGFTYKEGTPNGSSYDGAEFYYTRNSYNLTFNDGYNVVKTESVKYEAPLSTYRDYRPDVPSAYEPGSVTFGGWYLNPECTGEEYKLDEHKMPADNVLLYAKWVPVTHTVKFYLDKAALEADTKLESHPDITVPHGSKADPTPDDPTNGSYTFVGWFYMEDGVEKAFDFANMPVTKDLQVYGKWSSNAIMKGILYYKSKDESGKPYDIADSRMVSALAGTSKTYEAKGDTELYQGYQEGYFPVTKSHTMLFEIEPGVPDGENWTTITNENGEEEVVQCFTFWYVKKDAVPYTVYYVTAEEVEGAEKIDLDGKTYYKVADTKTVSDNRKAVVTEVFEPVAGYMPDAYQKRLVVSVDEYGNPDTDGNVIIFYYTKDNTRAYYTITYYKETLSTDENGNPVWQMESFTSGSDAVGKEITEVPKEFENYTFDPAISTTSGKLESGKILELKLYYRRNRTTLTVTKSGMQNIDDGQSFLFKVTGPGLPAGGLLIAINGEGSETISGLVVGQDYTVTEVESWSWRYSATSQSIKLKSTGNEVTISNTRDKSKWLDGDCYAENVFNSQGSTN